MTASQKIILSAPLAVIVLANATAASAQGPVSISLSPLRFELAGYPGQKLAGTVKVLNAMDGWLPVALKVLDFSPEGEEGNILVGEGASGDGRHSLKSWVRFAYDTFSVAPGQRFPVDFTADIPLHAEPGTYYGTILARTTAQEGGGGPTIVTRVGAILLVDVYGEVREEVRVAEFRAPRAAWGSPVPLVIRSANTGTIREKPEGTLSIANMFGKTVSTVPLPERNVLPGTIRRVEIPVSEGLFMGRYTVQLAAAYGLENAVALRAEESFWFVDWRNAGLPALIFIGLAVFLTAKRRQIAAAFRSFGSRGESLPKAPAPDDGRAPAPEKRGGGRTPRKIDL